MECQRTFTLSPKGPRYDEKFKDQVLAAYQDRMSILRTLDLLPDRHGLSRGKNQEPARVPTHAAAQSKRRRARTR